MDICFDAHYFCCKFSGQETFLTAVYFLPQLVNFVSDIGGQLGLWIGFSVLTLAEFLELIMLMCHLAVKKCFKKNGTSESYLPN